MFNRLTQVIFIITFLTFGVFIPNTLASVLILGLGGLLIGDLASAAARYDDLIKSEEQHG